MRVSDTLPHLRLRGLRRRVANAVVPAMLAVAVATLAGQGSPPPREVTSVSLLRQDFVLQPSIAPELGAQAESPVPSPEPAIAPETATDSRQKLSARSGRTDEEPKPTATPRSLEEQFISKIVEPAKLSKQETGVPASVTMAQAILESDWGRSRLAKEANNYFGLKARSKPGSAGIVYVDTWEVINGQSMILKEPFRAYVTLVDSFIDHGRYFLENNRYALAMLSIDNAREFARQIHKAGYATDPDYSNKLIRLMDRFNLYSYDEQQRSPNG
ncbi:MAG: glucosaminidase domain-containing protein [Chloroflexi bacterium]|nr:glucosaminidase domain-containing protein [Chloroflexota bacterium]